MKELLALIEASTFSLGIISFFYFGIPAYTWYRKQKHKSEKEFSGPDYF